MKIIYQIDFQYKTKDCDVPVAAGNVITSSGEETPMMLIPAVGDFVKVGGILKKMKMSAAFRAWS